MFGSRRSSALVPIAPTRYQPRYAPGSFILRSRRMRPGPRTGYPRGMVTAPSSRVGEPLSARLRVSEPALKDPAEAVRQLPRPASSEEIAVGLVVIAPAGMLETEPGALRSRRKLERHHRVAEPAPGGRPPRWTAGHRYSPCAEHGAPKFQACSQTSQLPQAPYASAPG